MVARATDPRTNERSILPSRLEVAKGDCYPERGERARRTSQEAPLPMPKSDPALDLLLAGLDGVTSRPMFGGFGLWRDGTFFAIVYRGRAYFKTTPATRPRYCAA